MSAEGGTQPAKLLGRRREREALDQLVADVIAGGSRVLVLRGEAGVGKSALLGHLSERVAGWRVVSAAGVESEMELAYSGLHELCVPLLGHLEELPVPQKFRVAPEGQAQRNQTFESLALAPGGRSLFTAVEGTLAPDGQTAAGEDRIRILRYEDRGPGSFEPVEEYFYLAETGQGVVEIVALYEDELLVLERGFQSDVGNTVRVYRVSLAGAEDVSDVPSLAAPGLEPVEKDLLVDLAGCPASGATTPGTQPNPLLDNYESLELGPRLPGGRRALLLQSDDNFSAGQVTRVVALGVENGQLR